MSRVCLCVRVQFMSLTYLLNAAWMAVTSFCAMPIIVYLMLRSICANEIEHRDYWFLDNYCLNLSRFGSSDTFRVLMSVVEQLLHSVLAVVQCIVIGPVCLWVGGWVGLLVSLLP